MIEFRKAIKKGYGEVKSNPVTKAAVVITPTALGVANLSLNLSRKKKDTELRKEQTEALNDLTRALRESEDKKVRAQARKTNVVFKKKHIEDIEDGDIIILPNPISKAKQVFTKKK